MGRGALSRPLRPSDVVVGPSPGVGYRGAGIAMLQASALADEGQFVSIAPPTSTARRATYRVEILVALVVIALAGPLVHEYKAQQASRYVLTAAIWDDHTFQLDDYAALDPPVLGVDRALKDGHTYSDKAPLQPILAVPLYAAYRAVGGEPASVQRLDENLGLWWITVWMATVPAAVLAALMYRVGRRYAPRGSLPATLSLFSGSILLPFAAVLFSHSLVSLLVFAAFVLVMGELSKGRALATGALLGAAVAVEYTAAVSVIVLGVFAAWRHRSSVAWVVAAGVPFAAGLAWYHTVVFGSPLSYPYRYSAFLEDAPSEPGLLAVFSRFDVQHLIEVFFDGRGFLLATPIIVVGLVGLVHQVRRRGPARQEAVVALALFVSFLLIPLFWANPWGGDSPGARYMTPALPLLVVGVAAIWQRAGILGRAATVVGTLTMGLATLTDPLLDDESPVGLNRVQN